MILYSWRENTLKLWVVGSNPGAVYWMGIFQIDFL